MSSNKSSGKAVEETMANEGNPAERLVDQIEVEAPTVHNAGLLEAPKDAALLDGGSSIASGNRKEYYCELCDGLFDSSQSYAEHQAGCHIGEAPEKTTRRDKLPIRGSVKGLRGMVTSSINVGKTLSTFPAHVLPNRSMGRGNVGFSIAPRHMSSSAQQTVVLNRPLYLQDSATRIPMYPSHGSVDRSLGIRPPVQNVPSSRMLRYPTLHDLLQALARGRRMQQRGFGPAITHGSTQGSDNISPRTQTSTQEPVAGQHASVRLMETNMPAGGVIQSRNIAPGDPNTTAEYSHSSVRLMGLEIATEGSQAENGVPRNQTVPVRIFGFDVATQVETNDRGNPVRGASTGGDVDDKDV